MKTQKQTTTVRFIRSLAMGIILSMLLFYSDHVFGTWTVEEYFPRPETTSTILLHNKCLLLNKTHTLRPNTDVSGLDEGVNANKLGGSFMNFFDGHIMGLIILALLLGVMIYFIRRTIKRKTILFS